MLRLPGTLPAGTVYQEVVSGIDLFATCAGLCGVPLFAGQQGFDHSPALLGDAGAVRDAALVQWLGPSRSAWDDGYPYRAIRTRRYTYCVGPDEPFRLLFDNDEDGLQLSNLFGRRSVAAVQAQVAPAPVQRRDPERRAVAGVSGPARGMGMIRVIKPEGFGAAGMGRVDHDYHGQPPTRGTDRAGKSHRRPRVHAQIGFESFQGPHQRSSPGSGGVGRRQLHERRRPGRAGGPVAGG